MKITLLTRSDELQKGLEELIKEFIDEYPYYETWIKENQRKFETFKRVVYKLEDNNEIVGYAMVNFSTNNSAKINGIFVYSNFQNRGYASNSLKLILQELKEKKYEYAFVQTRLTNKTVVHLFDKLGFVLVGKKIHDVEKQENWVAAYDLLSNQDIKKMKLVASQEYEGFINI